TEASPTDRREGAWCYQGLPYLEQEAVFNHPSVEGIDKAGGKLFYCPARRPATTYEKKAKTGYAGDGGSDPEGGSDGVVIRGPYARVRILDVTDGTSYTGLAGERQLNSSLFGRAPDDNSSCYRAGWNGDFEVYRVGTAQPAHDIESECDNT